MSDCKGMTEAQIQSACVIWLWNTHPKTRGMFFAVNNNASHVVKGLQNKSVGVVAGVSDTILLWNRTDYLIEFKTPNGRQSKHQMKWDHDVTGWGYDYFIVRSLEDFKKVIEGIIL